MRLFLRRKCPLLRCLKWKSARGRLRGLPGPAARRWLSMLSENGWPELFTPGCWVGVRDEQILENIDLRIWHKTWLMIFLPDNSKYWLKESEWSHQWFDQTPDMFLRNHKFIQLREHSRKHAYELHNIEKEMSLCISLSSFSHFLIRVCSYASNFV